MSFEDRQQHPSTSTNPTPKVYLGATDVAALAGVSRQIVAVASRAGKLRPAAQTVSGVRLYEPGDAAVWVAARRRAAP